MFFSSKQPAAGSQDPIAHEAWTRTLFEKVAKTKQFEVDVLEVTKTVSTIGRDRGGGGVTIELNDGLLANILGPPVRAGIHFDSDNHVTLYDESQFTAEHGVGYYWLHSGVVTSTGEEVLQTLANSNANISPLNLPAVEFNIFSAFSGVLPDLYTACMNAKTQGRVARIRFFAAREMTWGWEHFAGDAEWFQKAFPLRDFVFWDGAKFGHEFIRRAD